MIYKRRVTDDEHYIIDTHVNCGKRRVEQIFEEINDKVSQILLYMHTYQEETDSLFLVFLQNLFLKGAHKKSKNNYKQNKNSHKPSYPHYRASSYKGKDK